MDSCVLRPIRAFGMANPLRGKHDAQLAFLLEQHSNRADLLIDSVFALLEKKTAFFKGDGLLARDTVGQVLARFVGGGGDGGVDVASANEAAAREAAAAEAVPRSLNVSVSAGARAALERAEAKRAAEAAAASGDGASDPVPMGTKCANNGCEVVYAGPQSCEGVCIHHTGTPVFHEGLKFWSCCEKQKVTDFGDFLNIPGCLKGRHVFSTKSEAKEQKRDCRTDFFQQGATVSFNVYAKRADPENCSFSIKRVPGPDGELEHVLAFHVHFEHEYDFTRSIALAGPVIVDECAVDILEPKVEIKLRKADGRSWDSIGRVLTDEEPA